MAIPCWWNINYPVATVSVQFLVCLIQRNILDICFPCISLVWVCYGGARLNCPYNSLTLGVRNVLSIGS